MKIYKTVAASLALLLATGAVAAAPKKAASACIIPAAQYTACRIPGRIAPESPQIYETGAGHVIALHTTPTRKVGILPPKEEEPAPLYTQDELELLACVIYQEAGGDSASDETRRMVGEVVLNRVNDPRFPDTIEDVLTQKSQYGRFYWTGVIWPARAVNEPDAVKRAYSCAEAVFTLDRLLPVDAVWQAEFVQGKEICAHQDGLYFCR